MTALEQVCGDCERKCDTNSCYEVDVREDTIDDLRLKVEALERKTKSLKADVEAWKGLSKDRYHKMVEVNLKNKELKERVKWHEETRELLLKTIAHQDSQLEFLR
jgi:uncharacterized surface protein with fasciclin (FAS1) repeats